MSSIPSAKGIDSTLALLRNPYEFIPDTCRDLEGDLFETRILFQKTICMTGAAAAEVFYSEDGLVRAGSMPKRTQRTLLGEKGIQGLDGEAHRHRKRMFMSLMASERIEALENTTRDLLDRYARDWQAAEKVVLYDEVREILTRAACAWSGVPLRDRPDRSTAAEHENPIRRGALAARRASASPRDKAGTRSPKCSEARHVPRSPPASDSVHLHPRKAATGDHAESRD